MMLPIDISVIDGKFLEEIQIKCFAEVSVLVLLFTSGPDSSLIHKIRISSGWLAVHGNISLLVGKTIKLIDDGQYNMISIESDGATVIFELSIDFDCEEYV